MPGLLLPITGPSPPSADFQFSTHLGYCELQVLGKVRLRSWISRYSQFICLKKLASVRALRPKLLLADHAHWPKTLRYDGKRQRLKFCLCRLLEANEGSDQQLCARSSHRQFRHRHRHAPVSRHLRRRVWCRRVCNQDRQREKQRGYARPSGTSRDHSRPADIWRSRDRRACRPGREDGQPASQRRARFGRQREPEIPLWAAPPFASRYLRFDFVDLLPVRG
jgi:hypothetical protein